MTYNFVNMPPAKAKGKGKKGPPLAPPPSPARGAAAAAQAEAVAEEGSSTVEEEDPLSPVEDVTALPTLTHGSDIEVDVGLLNVVESDHEVEVAECVQSDDADVERPPPKKKRTRISKRAIPDYHWTEDTTTQLAKHIKLYPKLYDKKQKDWLNLTAKNILWTEIGEALEPPASGKFFQLVLFVYFLPIQIYISRIRRNLSIHIARFSASESLRVYTNIYKNSPLFASR